MIPPETNIQGGLLVIAIKEYKQNRTYNNSHKYYNEALYVASFPATHITYFITLPYERINNGN